MEDDQQFCLRWNNHQSTIIQNFDTLLESGTLVDCTLAAEGKYLKAHKVVLSACSPYFEGLLSEHYDKHPVFILKDVKFKELKAMMDYMYRGEVNISQDQLTALLKAAESLQIKGLSDSRTDKGTGNTGNTTTGGSKDNTRPAKTASSTAAASASAAAVDIPHSSSGLTIEKNSKVPRQSIQQVSVSDQLENSASPQLRGHSSREGSQSPTRKRKRLRRRSLGNDDNSMENHEASNSSDVNMTAPALGVAPVAAEEKNQADPADSIGRSALMQQLTKPADEMLQMPLEKPEPSEDMIQPKSEYQDDQESVEDLTHFDDDMNDLNEMEQDNSRAGPSHDPSQHGGIQPWHIAGDRSNASVVGAAAGPGAGDEVFLAAAEAAQAQRDSQAKPLSKKKQIKKVSKNQLPADFQDSDDFSTMQEVHFIRVKEEVNVDTDESLPFEISDYIEANYNTSNEADESTENSNRLEFKKYYAECGDQSVSMKEINDLATLYDLIDFTCTKCRKTCKNADYFLMKTDLQCTDCQATMKFQCPQCKLLFRQFDSACRHARQNCQIDDDSVKSSNIQSQRKSQSPYISEIIRNCSACNFSTSNTLELRRHFRHEHPSLLRSADSHVCWLCGRRYKSRESMLKHARLCGRPAHIRCQFCAYRTKRREHLRVHMRHRHPDPESCHGSTYDCPNCKKKYKYLTSMKSHAKNCTEGSAASTSTLQEADE